MLTIALTAEDLGRIRFARAPAPILEMVLMLFELRQRRPYGSETGPEWQKLVRTGFPGAARPLLQLIPSRNSAVYLDVLTANPDQAFEQVRHMPRAIVDADLARITELNIGPIPAWLQRFAQGDAGVRDTFDRALRAFYATCLAPHWPDAAARFHDDVAHRTVTLSQQGVASLLNTLTPDLRLVDLTITARYPWDRHARLDGNGLVLVPSAFWTGHPLFTWDPHEASTYVLIYPARAAREDFKLGNALDALLGVTRANALRTLHRPQTTSGLAESLCISIASASKHATTLRRAGLITTNRQGQAVEHRLTQLGISLLQAN